MLQPELNEFPLKVTSVSRVFFNIIIIMVVFSMKMRLYFFPTQK